MPTSNRIILTDVDGVLLEWEHHFTKWMLQRTLFDERGARYHPYRLLPNKENTYEMAERFGQLQQLEAILEYLNIELRRLKSKTFRKYLENYNRALSSRDAMTYVEGEDDVVDMDKIINDFALIRNQWLGITKGLDQKQWQITNIVKLRVAGMEDADIK